MSNQEMKYRKISLTGRAPIRIIDADWSIIASTDWYSSQANEFAWIKVCKHDADGRIIVSGRRTSGPGGMCIGYEGAISGYILPADTDIPATIQLVADEIGKPGLAQHCCNDLPLEDIT